MLFRSGHQTTAALGGLPPLAESTVCVPRMCSAAAVLVEWRTEVCWFQWAPTSERTEVECGGRAPAWNSWVSVLSPALPLTCPKTAGKGWSFPHLGSSMWGILK